MSPEHLFFSHLAWSVSPLDFLSQRSCITGGETPEFSGGGEAVAGSLGWGGPRGPGGTLSQGEQRRQGPRLQPQNRVVRCTDASGSALGFLTCLVGPPRRRSPCFCFLKGPPGGKGSSGQWARGSLCRAVGSDAPGSSGCLGFRVPLTLGPWAPPLQTWVGRSLLPRASIRQVCCPVRSPGSGAAANRFPSSADWETKEIDEPVLPVFPGDGTRRGKRWRGDFWSSGCQSPREPSESHGKDPPLLSACLRGNHMLDA